MFDGVRQRTRSFFVEGSNLQFCVFVYLVQLGSCELFSLVLCLPVREHER